MDGKEIGARIKGLRARSGLNQTEFAKRCGVSLNGQSNFERGLNLPGGDYLLKLAEQGADITYILTGSPGACDQAESELLQRYRASSTDVRSVVLRALGIAIASKKSASVAISGGEQGQVVAGDVTQRKVTFNVGTKKKTAPK